LSTEAIDAMARQCVQQVLDLLDGKAPDGVVNSEVLDRAPSGQNHQEERQ
jgi:hypothetical protein